MTTATREYKVVGTRPVRHDGAEKVTGRAVYGADMNLPGMLYGKVLRSPHAHARITRLDTSKAEAHPEARAVVTNTDFAPSDPVGPVAVLGQMPTDNVLARDKVLYRGHAIAAVAAASAHAAEEILSLIEVDYEVLPAYSGVEEAMAEDAVPLHDTWPNNPDLPGGVNVAAQDSYRFGDPDAGFAQADRVFEREFRTKTVHQGYIEPQNATAWWSPDGRLTVWCSSQGHFGVRDNVARILGVPVSRVKVVPLEIGGGFGGKIPPYLEPSAAMLSKKSGHPVKMVMDRAEVLQATGPTSGSLVRMKIGVTNEGKITAAHCWMALEAGAFPGAPLAGAASAVFAPYLIENVQIDGYDVVSNKPRTQAYRAPGAPIVMYCAESLMDEIAGALEIDSVEFRLLNVARQGDRRADGVMNGIIGAEEVMQAVREHPHYSAPLEQVEGKLRGRGWSMGFCRNNTGMACVVANVLDNGTVSLVEGSVDIGGSRTAIAQQFAEVLGIPVEDVNPMVGDTDTIGYTSVTGGSGVAFKSGWAAHEAAMDVMQQLIVRASLLWDTEPENVEYVDGALQHKSDSELRFTFQEIAGRLPGNRRPRRRTRQPEPRRTGRLLRRQHGGHRAGSRHRQGGHTEIHRVPGRRIRHPPVLRRGTDTGRRRPGHRLGAQRGVLHERGRRHGEHEPPRLPYAHEPRSADDRRRDNRGEQPRPPVRSARRRRGEHSPPARGPRQRHPRRRRSPHDQPPHEPPVSPIRPPRKIRR